jgi:hypothetical protein
VTLSPIEFSDDEDFSMEDIFDTIISQIPDNVILQLMEES